MIRVCIVAPYNYTIPAIKGGALEQVVQSICDINEIEEKIDITVLATYDEELTPHDYKHTKFIYFNKTPIDEAWYFSFRIIKKVTKKYIPAFPRIINVKRWLECNENKFDVIVYEDGLTYMLPYLFKKIDRKKVISHLHWLGDPNKNSNKYFSTLMPVSEYVAHTWENKCVEPEVKVKVVKNGVYLDRFQKKISQDEKNRIRQSLGIDNDTLVILYIGRIVQEKGVYELIEAMNLIDSNNIVLLLIGSAKFAMNSMTQYEKKIKDMIDKSDKKILQLGFIRNTDLYQYQNISDIAVIPTIIEEAAPLVCVENMAAGIPLIITNSGGMPEYVDASCSIMVEKDENLSQNIAKIISELANDRSKLEYMSKCAIEKSINYSVERTYENFVNVIVDSVGWQKIADEN